MGSVFHHASPEVAKKAKVKYQRFATLAEIGSNPQKCPFSARPGPVCASSPRPEALADFAICLIADKPVKPCDGGVFRAFYLLLKKEQNAPADRVGARPGAAACPFGLFAPACTSLTIRRDNPPLFPARLCCLLQPFCHTQSAPEPIASTLSHRPAGRLLKAFKSGPGFLAAPSFFTQPRLCQPGQRQKLNDKRCWKVGVCPAAGRFSPDVLRQVLPHARLIHPAGFRLPDWRRFF